MRVQNWLPYRYHTAQADNMRVQNWSYRYHTAQADILEDTELIALQISHCPRRYYWGYRTDRHTDITLLSHILLRVQNWWLYRYHTAQTDIIEGTELITIQMSHCPNRYYWGYRTDHHTDVTLPRQILLRVQNWSPYRCHTAQADITGGTELIAMQISHSFYLIKFFVCSSHRMCKSLTFVIPNLSKLASSYNNVYWLRVGRHPVAVVI